MTAKNAVEKRKNSRLPKNPRKYLTPRQRELVAAFNGDLSSAARSIGMDPDNAREMYNKYALVREHIKKKQDVATIECGKRMGRDMAVTTANVLKELSRLAFFDPRKLFNADGTPKHITELDDDTAMSVAGLDVEDIVVGSGQDRKQIGVVRKYKIADKGRNLERLGNYLGMFIQRTANLPPDFLSRPLEDQQYFCQHGYYPDDTALQREQPSLPGS